MDKLKVKVISTTIGRFDVDSIQVKIDDNLIEICLDKSVNVTQYSGKEILLSMKNDKYEVEAYVEDKPRATKK